MNSAVQQAKKLVNSLRDFQERREAAQKTWETLIGELERQANQVAEEVNRNGVTRRVNGQSARVWIERDESEASGKRLKVLFAAAGTEAPSDAKDVATARFFVDPRTLRVVGDRKPIGAPEAHRGRSGFKRFADLGDILDTTVGAFLDKLLEFLKWASVGEGSGEHEFRIGSA